MFYFTWEISEVDGYIASAGSLMHSLKSTKSMFSIIHRIDSLRFTQEKEIEKERNNGRERNGFYARSEKKSFWYVLSS